MGSEASVKPNCLDKKNKNKSKDFVWAEVFDKTFLESFDRINVEVNIF